MFNNIYILNHITRSFVQCGTTTRTHLYTKKHDNILPPRTTNKHSQLSLMKSFDMGQMTSTGHKQSKLNKCDSTLEFETGKVFKKKPKPPKLVLAENSADIPVQPVPVQTPDLKGNCYAVFSDTDLVELGDGIWDQYSPVDPELTRTVPTVFRWENGGNEVYLSGSFTDWNARIPMSRSHGDFSTIIELPEGEHQFKFFVDGHWIHDPNLPTTGDTYGGRNNTVTVQKSDFEVMEALNSDDKQATNSVLSLESAAGSYSQLIPSHNNPVVVKGDGVHSSVPPALPPQLLNVNLNKCVPNVNEPSLLQEPAHVSVNHLYALSIKDGVMVVSSCLRYREKYITTLLYRPVTLPP